MALLITLLFAISSTVMSDWELLAEQNVVTGGYFSSSVKTQNIGNEGDALFSKIAGITDPSPYKNIYGKYTFKLIFTPKDGSAEQIIEWRQTSWLTDAVSPWATDVEIINAPQETNTDSGTWFRGLAETYSANCYIDGNGNGHSHWFNCVCSITPWNNAIPGYDATPANRMRLWIEIPVVVLPEFVCLTTSIAGYKHLNGQYKRNINLQQIYQIAGLYESDLPYNCDDTINKIWKYNSDYPWGVDYYLSNNGGFTYAECDINPSFPSNCNGYWVIDGIRRSADEFQVTVGECLYGSRCSKCSGPAPTHRPTVMPANMF